MVSLTCRRSGSIHCRKRRSITSSQSALVFWPRERRLLPTAETPAFLDENRRLLTKTTHRFSQGGGRSGRVRLSPSGLPEGLSDDRGQKVLRRTRGQSLLFRDYRYFFYLTNDRDHSATEIVLLANDRCDQKNLHAQLKGGVRALHAPVDNLVSNWTYMVMTSLAWNLKAWWALHLSESEGERGESQRQEKHRVLRMEFKTF